MVPATTPNQHRSQNNGKKLTEDAILRERSWSGWLSCFDRFRVRYRGEVWQFLTGVDIRNDDFGVKICLCRLFEGLVFSEAENSEYLERRNLGSDWFSWPEREALLTKRHEWQSPDYFISFRTLVLDRSLCAAPMKTAFLTGADFLVLLVRLKSLSPIEKQLQGSKFKTPREHWQIGYDAP